MALIDNSFYKLKPSPSIQRLVHGFTGWWKTRYNVRSAIALPQVMVAAARYDVTTLPQLSQRKMCERTTGENEAISWGNLHS